MTPLATAYPEPSQSPGLALWRATNAWQRRIRAALDPFDLTHVQFVLLANLVAAGSGPMMQRELAELAVTDPMMTSQVLRALERNGLVERASHPDDGRALAVTSTVAGAALVNRANPAVEEADRAYFSVLGEEVPELTRMLGRLG